MRRGDEVPPRRARRTTTRQKARSTLNRRNAGIMGRARETTARRRRLAYTHGRSALFPPASCPICSVRYKLLYTVNLCLYTHRTRVAAETDGRRDRIIDVHYYYGKNRKRSSCRDLVIRPCVAGGGCPVGGKRRRVDVGCSRARSGTRTVPADTSAPDRVSMSTATGERKKPHQPRTSSPCVRLVDLPPVSHTRPPATVR